MTTIPVTRGHVTKNLGLGDLEPALDRLNLGVDRAGKCAYIAGLGKFTRDEITALIEQVRRGRQVAK